MIGAIQSGSTMSTDMMSKMRERMFEKLANGADQIDLSALQAQAAQSGKTDDHFSKLIDALKAADTNGDGKVSKAEFQSIKMPERPQGAGRAAVRRPENPDAGEAVRGARPGRRR